jgi:hypothetical protein
MPEALRSSVEVLDAYLHIWIYFAQKRKYSTRAAKRNMKVKVKDERQRQKHSQILRMMCALSIKQPRLLQF